MQEQEFCPSCKNKKIILWETTQSTKYYSKTGKCLKVDNDSSVVMFGFECKCGWKSETFTE